MLNRTDNIRLFRIFADECNSIDFCMAEDAEHNRALKISVVMATYNGGRYLDKQLDSIMAQTYPIYELIVQDDGSTDNTLSILDRYAKQNAMMRVYANTSGCHGVNGNFFSAMARAEGDYIAICDQDDLWECDKLRLQAEAIGEKAMCTGFSVPFSSDGFPAKADMRIPNLHLIRNTYLSQIPGHTMLFRKELLGYLKGGAEMPLYYDWQLACVASAMESVVFVNRTLVHFRRHAGAATAVAPVSSALLSGGAWNYVTVSLFHHKALQREVRNRFMIVLPFLQGLPFQTHSLAEAIKMSQLQLQRGPMAFLRRMVFFVRHQHHIFHTEEHRPVIRLLRAIFFVYSCGYYYRSHLKK